MIAAGDMFGSISDARSEVHNAKGESSRGRVMFLIVIMPGIFIRRAVSFYRTRTWTVKLRSEERR